MKRGGSGGGKRHRELTPVCLLTLSFALVILALPCSPLPLPLFLSLLAGGCVWVLRHRPVPADQRHRCEWNRQSVIACISICIGVCASVCERGQVCASVCLGSLTLFSLLHSLTFYHLLPLPPLSPRQLAVLNSRCSEVVRGLRALAKALLSKRVARNMKVSLRRLNSRT